MLNTRLFGVFLGVPEGAGLVPEFPSVLAGFPGAISCAGVLAAPPGSPAL